MTVCANCDEPIRRVKDGDGIDPRDYDWTHNWTDTKGVEHVGSPYCDISLTATPKKAEREGAA